MGLLAVEYQEDYCTNQGIGERECIGNTTISKTSELVPLGNFIAPNTVSNGGKEKMKELQRRCDQF